MISQKYKISSSVCFVGSSPSPLNIFLSKRMTFFFFFSNLCRHFLKFTSAMSFHFSIFFSSWPGKYDLPFVCVYNVWCMKNSISTELRQRKLSWCRSKQISFAWMVWRCNDSSNLVNAAIFVRKWSVCLRKCDSINLVVAQTQNIVRRKHTWDMGKFVRKRFPESVIAFTLLALPKIWGIRTVQKYIIL